MGNCTVPKLIKPWFDAKFGDCCDWHDERYVARDCYKVQADFGVSVRIAKKNVKYIPVGVIVFVALSIHPLAYYMWWTD